MRARTAFTGVQVDSRRIVPGDLFVAVGRGSEFVDDAFARGAAATLVPHDAFAALARIGRAVRERSSARVVGITGSMGKTSTKDILAALERSVRAHDRGRGKLQQRDRSAAHALPPGSGHGGLRPRARDARLRPDRRARRDRPAADRRRHERRSGPPRARGFARRCRTGERRVDRGAAGRRHGDRAGGLPGLPRRHRGRTGRGAGSDFARTAERQSAV